MQKSKQGKSVKPFDGSEVNPVLGSEEHWSSLYILLASFSFRVLLVFYGLIHDYFFKV